MMKTVLILDDEITFSELLAELIREYGHDAVRLDSKLSGYYWAIANNPDLILTDIHAPKIDGLECFKLARTSKVLRSTPIVIISGGGDQYRVQALELGATEVFQKPIDTTQLEEMLVRVFKTH